MASRTTPTTLGSLEFNQIKKSLTDYLRDQETLSGYNFEGSAMQSVIDLLAYNTFYYAYYANVINAEAFLDSAQKDDSIISLCKPLGFTVSSRSAAVAKVFVGGLVNSTSIPAGTRFLSASSDGIQYAFYNLEDIPLVGGNSPEVGFDIYEANTYVQFEALTNFDFTNQKIAISANGFDIDSIKVTITERIDDATVDRKIWSRVENVGYTSKADENIYFVERTSSGFVIIFGGLNGIGRSIDDKIESINIRYILTNGSEANNLTFFTLNGFNGENAVVQVLSTSKNGKTDLNLDEIRFLAPKWFSAQERAVTVNDYKALLLQAKFFTSQNQFNVFGGQDLTPPRHGRVFVSSNLNSTDPIVPEMINYLKERSIITVFPEYVQSESLNIFTDFNFYLSPGTDNTTSNRSNILSEVKSLFRQFFEVSAQYNLSFSASDFIDVLRSNSNPDISNLLISPDYFTIYVKDTLQSGKEYNFNLGNEFLLPINDGIDVTEPFIPVSTIQIPAGSRAVLKMFVSRNSDKNIPIKLQLWSRNDETGEQIGPYPGDYGSFIANKGVLNIKSGVIGNLATLNVLFAKRFITIGLNNLVSFNYGTVTIG
jgi:hypothetical protein